MEFPKLNSTDDNLFNQIKDKLGFSDPDADKGFENTSSASDTAYRDDFGEGYEEYADDYGESYDGYSDDEYNALNATSSADPYYPVTVRPINPSVSASRRGAKSPRLISIEDVRAHTQIPDSLNRDPLPPRHVTSPADTSTRRFRPAVSEADLAESSYSDTASRSLEVLTPIVYGEVERVVDGLQSGDAVILILRNTPENVAKRILDFSFGAASMVDASVDCIADKIFAICIGSGLSDTEKQTLKNQGVL